MAALGNVLSGLSMLLVQFLPTISLGIYNISIALDFSHLTTFITALYGGPALGGLTGLVGGLVAANEFGFSKGNLVTGFGLPIGKALTGITAGFLMQALRSQEKRNRLLIVVSTFFSYIPEGVFTVFLFLVMFPFVFGTPVFILSPIVTAIIMKASIEMFAEGVVLAALSINQSFTSLVKSLFVPTEKRPAAVINPKDKIKSH